MSTGVRCSLACLILIPLYPIPGSADHTRDLPELTVHGQYVGFDRYQIKPDLVSAPAVDSARLLGRIPGSNVNSNGAVTGIAQYRGMYGDRVNVLVDGIKISPGGPNAMDAPLSYIPRSRLESLEMIRGIAPVSAGNETIGGSLHATSMQGRFTDSEQFGVHGQVGATGHDVDNGYEASTLLSLANKTHRLHVAASRQDGDDYEFAGGEVSPGEYDRNSYEIGYGYRQGALETGFDYVRNDTNESGTPSLPMDIVYIDADILRGNWRNRWRQIDIISRVYWSQVDHGMSNFDLRLPPLMGAGLMTMKRYSLTGSEDVGYGFHAAMAFAGGRLMLGTDGHIAEHMADIYNPLDPGFRIRNYNHIQRDVFGVFGEWKGKLATKWDLQLGLRYTRVNMDAGIVSAAGFPMAMLQANAGTLANSFNTADRSTNDNNIDAVVLLVYALGDETDIEMGFARKTRSPSYQERYLWLPLESTGGLADGNNYIGDINLDPEIAYQFELGVDWHNEKSFFSPRIFYHHVDDYIQGIDTGNRTAMMFNAMMTGMLGSSAKILQFANVDARLYGIDADFGHQFGHAWCIDGTISLVKGERRDNGDNLYRISPANGSLGVTYQRDNWFATLETVAYLDKEDVSAVNGEPESAGYVLLNLYGNYKMPGSGLTLAAGVDNILDKEYAPHLNGVNRVRNVDVPVGVRVPGPGINPYVSVNFTW